MDIYLKFPTREEAEALLFTQNEDCLVPKVPGSIDVVGTIYTGTGKMITVDGETFEETVPVPGWHINIRHDVILPELEPYQIFPITPSRVWF